MKSIYNSNQIHYNMRQNIAYKSLITGHRIFHEYASLKKIMETYNSHMTSCKSKPRRTFHLKLESE